MLYPSTHATRTCSRGPFRYIIPVIRNRLAGMLLHLRTCAHRTAALRAPVRTATPAALLNKVRMACHSAGCPQLLFFAHSFLVITVCSVLTFCVQLLLQRAFSLRSVSAAPSRRGAASAANVAASASSVAPPAAAAAAARFTAGATPATPPPGQRLSEAAIKRLPKAELHRHLDGCVRPRTILELGREQVSGFCVHSSTVATLICATLGYHAASRHRRRPA